jgi:transcription initiation factor TFIID subunit 6
MSVWNPDNIRDVAESVGIASLSDNVVDELARDVDFRIGLVLEEALKFMRHGKRTTLGTQDISNALRVLNVEPLYGYESTRPLRFGEASIGPGQPLYYIEDEEVDFEKLINSALPKVPREITFTAHWLAVEGVQPSIPQNPTSSDSRHQELLPKGIGANPHLAAVNGHDNIAIKPLVKHVLSKESIELYSKLSSALIDETNEEWRNAALASLHTDPSIHQLTTYLVGFFNEKVTHNLKNLFVLTQMMHATAALLSNPTIYLDPYIASIVPPVLTCLVGKHLGPSHASDAINGNGNGNGHTQNPLAHFPLRDLAASILVNIAKRYANTSTTLKPRIARTCLKYFLDPGKPFGTHYGAITGLTGITGPEGVRLLILPNLKLYDAILREGLADESRKMEAEMVIGAIMRGLELLERTAVGRDERMVNGTGDVEGARDKLVEKVGEVMADRIVTSGRVKLVSAVLENDVSL